MMHMPWPLKPLSAKEDLLEVRLELDLPVPGLRDLLELELLELELNELPVLLDELPVPVVLLDADGVGDLNADRAMHTGAVIERGRGTSLGGGATRQGPTTSPCHPSGAARCLLSPERGWWSWLGP